MVKQKKVKIKELKLSMKEKEEAKGISLEEANQHAEEDEEFEKEDDLLEVSTNKVNLKIAAPSTGKLIKILAQEGDMVTVGDVLALIETIND